MRPKTAPVNQWPRYAGAVAAVFWALGLAAGCHLPHAAAMTPAKPAVSAAHARHDVATLAHGAPADADWCSPLDHACKHVAQACPATDTVALAVVVAVAAFAVASAWPPVSMPRAPPPSARFTPFRSGRMILTRICIARL